MDDRREEFPAATTMLFIGQWLRSVRSRMAAMSRTLRGMMYLYMLDLERTYANTNNRGRRQKEKARAREVIPVINYNLACLNRARHLASEAPMNNNTEVMLSVLRIELILYLLEIQDVRERLPLWLVK